MICIYTEKSHINTAEKNDIHLCSFSATSPDIFHKNRDFNMLPPSRIDTGYKFIKANEKLNTKKVDNVSLFDEFIIKIINTVRRLNIIPPKHTMASFKYDIPLVS